MKKDRAIESIRQTRRKISAMHRHDIRSLIEHYRALESKYADRLVRESTTQYAPK